AVPVAVAPAGEPVGRGHAEVHGHGGLFLPRAPHEGHGSWQLESPPSRTRMTRTWLPGIKSGQSPTEREGSVHCTVRCKQRFVAQRMELSLQICACRSTRTWPSMSVALHWGCVEHSPHASRTWMENVCSGCTVAGTHALPTSGLRSKQVALSQRNEPAARMARSAKADQPKGIGGCLHPREEPRKIEHDVQRDEGQSRARERSHPPCRAARAEAHRRGP